MAGFYTQMGFSERELRLVAHMEDLWGYFPWLMGLLGAGMIGFQLYLYKFFGTGAGGPAQVRSLGGED